MRGRRGGIGGLVVLLAVAALGGVGLAWLRGSPSEEHAPGALTRTVAIERLVTLRVIFPEGFTRADMAARVAAVRKIAIRKRHVRPRLTESGYLAATSVVKPPAAFRKDVRRHSIEGFLFPATYAFTQKTRAAELVAEQLAAFERAFGGLNLRYARSKNLTPYDVLVIASMIEKEAVVPAERPLIAAVIYNRLHEHMPLGIDATIRYGLDIPGTKSLTESAIRSSNPYNTRRFRGLPPTPIANPGLASLRAAAHPARVDYLYYVRKPDKRHHFFTADVNAFLRKACEYGYGCS